MSFKLDYAGIGNLMPMPGSLPHLSRLAAAPDDSLKDIVRVIELDTGLTANILRWSNSAWSGAQTPIATVKQAVVRLGINQILKLVVGQQIAGPMRGVHDGYELEEKQLWAHSVAAALTVEELAVIYPRPLPPLAFTAALMHDLGKVFLNQYVDEDKRRQIHVLMEKEGLNGLAAEKAVLGTEHASVGADIAAHWNFPEPLVMTIRHHHDDDCPPDSLLASVRLANAVAKLLGIGLGIEQMHLEMNSNCLDYFGLTSMDLENLCAVVMGRLQESLQLWEG